MRLPLRSAAIGLLFCLTSLSFSFASAYNARPKLVVILVIDQFRGDYLERYRDQFGEGGYRLFLDHGANFTDCYYNHANTSTAPGHAALLTGAYPVGNGILANEWWDAKKQRLVTSVEDDSTQLVGEPGNSAGASPHNLLADTLGDELKLATQGKSRVFGISIKDRAAILPAGFSGSAYWVDQKTGAWVTSTYYRSELPRWAQDFNDSKRAEKYLNQEWKDSQGNVLRTIRPDKNGNFFGAVTATPLANDYEFDFARELITYEKLGAGPATDLLVISLSANDILGHQVGPDAPELQAMILATDRQLAGFFDFLGKEIGLANVWIGFSADHGVAPVRATATRLHIPNQIIETDDLAKKLNADLSAKLSPGKPAKYVFDADMQLAWINPDAFTALKMKEADAEQAVGEALKRYGFRGYYTKAQLARGDVPKTHEAVKYLNNYSPYGGWYVLAVPPAYVMGGEEGADHGSPYSYDAHVPLAFYGLPFQPGTYRTHAEPIDLAPTLASLLGINYPTQAAGRVLTEALSLLPRASRSAGAPGEHKEDLGSHGITSAAVQQISAMAGGK